MFSPRHASSQQANDRHGTLLDPRSPSSNNTVTSSPRENTSANTSYAGYKDNSDNASINSDDISIDHNSVVANYPPRFTLRVINPDTDEDDEEDAEDEQQREANRQQQQQQQHDHNAQYKPALVSSMKSTPEIPNRSLTNPDNGNNENSEMVIAPPSSTPNSWNRNQENQISPSQLHLNAHNSDYSQFEQQHQQPLIRRVSKVLVESHESDDNNSNNHNNNHIDNNSGSNNISNGSGNYFSDRNGNNATLATKKSLGFLPPLDIPPLLSENESHLLSPSLSLLSNGTSTFTSIFQSHFNNDPPELPQHGTNLTSSEKNTNDNNNNIKVAPSTAQQSINATIMNSLHQAQFQQQENERFIAPHSVPQQQTVYNYNTPPIRSSRNILNEQRQAMQSPLPHLTGQYQQQSMSPNYHNRAPSYSQSVTSTAATNTQGSSSRYSKASYSLTNNPDAIKLYRSMALKTNDPTVQLTYAKYLLEVAALYDPKEKRQTFRPNLSLSLPTPKRPNYLGAGRPSLDSRRSSTDTHVSNLTTVTASFRKDDGGFGRMLSADEPYVSEEQSNKKKKKMLEEEGVRWIKRLAKNNVGEAAYLLALWYDRGMYGIKKSSSKAVKFYEVAATTKIPEAMYAVAQYHERERDYMTSFQLYEEAANLGLVEALYRIALINLNGEFGSRRNVQTAIHLLIKASEKAATSCPDAPFTLGLLLVNDYPTVNMPTELIQSFGGSFAAIAYFEHAAEMGMGMAQCRLGEIYENGLYGTHVNVSKAYHYFELAANSNNAQAMFELSKLCNHGIQMPQEYSEQMELIFEQDESDWINKSVRNEDAAFRWCHLAADKHFAEAYYLLGWYYEMGIGIPRDYKQAVLNYTKASKAGHNQAEARINTLSTLTKQEKEENKRATANFQNNASQDSSCVVM